MTSYCPPSTPLHAERGWRAEVGDTHYPDVRLALLRFSSRSMTRQAKVSNCKVRSLLGTDWRKYSTSAGSGSFGGRVVKRDRTRRAMCSNSSGSGAIQNTLFALQPLPAIN